MTIYRVKGGEDMIKNMSLKMFHFVTDESGKDVTKSRSLNNLNTDGTDANLNALAAVYESLTGESYYNIEKVITHVV